MDRVQPSLLELAWANPLYTFGALVGLAIGIFYGLDGWRGNTANEALQDLPRVKNLTWVLGPGVAAFFGDTKALDPDAKKVQLLLAYFAPCLGAALLVVVIWGIIIFIGRLIATQKGQNFGYQAGDSIGDYFFYGYRYYRARLDEAAANRTARFHAAYRTQLTYSIAAAGAVFRQISRDERIEVAKFILKCISAVIKSYHGDEDNSNRIRANVMLVMQCDEQLRAELLFAGDRRANISRCLKLITYDTDEAQAKIAIPLSDAMNAALPGAPTAFHHADGIDVINDTSKINYKPSVPAKAREEITSYFKESAFQSFGSVRIIAGGHTVGVVNVDARMTHVFGRDESEHVRIAEYLLPFCTTLGVVFSEPMNQGA